MGSWHDRPDEQKLRDMQEYLRRHPEKARELGKPMATGPGNNSGDGCVTVLVPAGAGITALTALAALAAVARGWMS